MLPEQRVQLDQAIHSLALAEVALNEERWLDALLALGPAGFAINSLQNNMPRPDVATDAGNLSGFGD